jgi:hypothetical protein
VLQVKLTRECDRGGDTGADACCHTRPGGHVRVRGRQPLRRNRKNPQVAPDTSDTKLLLRLKGRKSLTKSFYDTSTELSFARTKPLDLFQDVRMDLGYSAARLPQGSGDYFRNAAWLDFNTDLRFRNTPVKLINVGGGYRWSRNQLFINDAACFRR